MTDDEFRELVERAHQIKELTRHEGWAYLVDRASVNVGAQQRKLLSGGVPSMEDYKRTAGFIEGAQFVLNLAEIVESEVSRERVERAERAAEQ